MPVLLALAAVAWLTTAATVAPSAQAAEFRRGIGISHAMAWARVEAGAPPAFAFPPFADRGNAPTTEELRTLRQTGFDFVRLAVDPGPFLQFQGARRDALDGILTDRVRLILKAGLAVIVDFHPSDLHPDYTARALTTGVEAPLYQDYLLLLARTASLLESLHSQKVALELMNEPPVPPGAWQPMLESAYAAVRRRAAGLVVVLDGGEEASAAALMAVNTLPFVGDRALLFSFHYYDPYQFTHQGASWNDARYLADVPYPARARPLDDSLEASAAAIAATALPEQQRAAAWRDAERRLESYRRSAFDATAIAAAFGKIADWAQAHGVPADRILLGEFGARKTQRQLYGSGAAERAQWFHDVRREAEARGFGWAVWAYRGGGGFALSRTETSDELEPRIAEALGLTPPSRTDAAPAMVNATSQAKP